MSEHAGIDPQRWSAMDPLVRARFHEIANHVTRLEGIITGLSMRVPEKPEVVPVLAEKVNNLETGARDTKRQIDGVDSKLSAKIDALDSKLDSLVLRVAGGTTILTGLITLAVNLLTR